MYSWRKNYKYFGISWYRKYYNLDVICFDALYVEIGKLCLRFGRRGRFDC